jgi:hypothetical protein
MNPTITIDLNDLWDYTQIPHIMKQHGIEQYDYTFRRGELILKHGLSADNSSIYGERIYRQAGHLKGWSKTLDGPSGSDMADIARDFKNIYGIELNRKDISIDVYQMPNSAACAEFERKMITDHIWANDGVAPLGNKDFETLLEERKYRNTKQLSTLIEFS